LSIMECIDQMSYNNKRRFLDEEVNDAFISTVRQKMRFTSVSPKTYSDNAIENVKLCEYMASPDVQIPITPSRKTPFSSFAVEDGVYDFGGIRNKKVRITTDADSYSANELITPLTPLNNADYDVLAPTVLADNQILIAYIDSDNDDHILLSRDCKPPCSPLCLTYDHSYRSPEQCPLSMYQLRGGNNPYGSQGIPIVITHHEYDGKYILNPNPYAMVPYNKYYINASPDDVCRVIEPDDVVINNNDSDNYIIPNACNEHMMEILVDDPVSAPPALTKGNDLMEME